MLRINAALEDHQADYQPTMIELEGNILNQNVYILVDPNTILSYAIPKVVEKF